MWWHTRSEEEYVWTPCRTLRLQADFQIKEQYNIVLLVPDNLPEDVSKQAGEISEMRELFTKWDPILNRFAYLSPDTVDHV